MTRRSTPPVPLRREDAAQRATALAWLAAGDYARARGWAMLLINDTHRWALLREIQAAAPEEHPVRAWIDEQAAWEAKDTQRAKYRKKPAA
jgi:hypothetical protein